MGRRKPRTSRASAPHGGADARADHPRRRRDAGRVPGGRRARTIPVGGVIAAENAIHPGMHSADICCSMAVTIFEDHEPKRLLVSGMKAQPFRRRWRERGAQFTPPREVMQAFADNFFLKSLTSVAVEHFATQGDGNHSSMSGA